MLRRECGRLLSKCTTLRVGGPVSSWLEAEDIKDLLEAIKAAEDEKKDITLIGRGSNILARDQGFDGIAVCLGKGFNFIETEEYPVVRVGAGTPVSLLVRKTAESGLTGCEFLAGIPGTFGGALFMNAGVRDIENPRKMIEVKDIILDVDVLDVKNRKRRTLKKEDIKFKYRSSGLDGRCIISGRLNLDEADRGWIEDRIGRYMKKREWISALGFPSAGSVFKNPDSSRPAGRLIEECGLKGMRVGGAEISKAHANFIVNVGGATSDDIMQLIGLAKERVNEKFGIDLELELKII